MVGDKEAKPKSKASIESATLRDRIHLSLYNRMDETLSHLSTLDQHVAMRHLPVATPRGTIPGRRTVSDPEIKKRAFHPLLPNCQNEFLDGADMGLT